ncbi:MAG: hypothetical protein BWY80_01395 [Firmicutes bacterium ADurb.Bin456]|nr:MAG: hypothetical protein BWY80_01395 [Firmicutes bacterium ADurb.Bin456]
MLIPPAGGISYSHQGFSCGLVLYGQVPRRKIETLKIQHRELK